MSYPTIYPVTYSYTGFQQSQGDNSFPGTQIDADLLGLQASLASLSTFMKSVMRSDGALTNGSVTFDSLSPALRTAGLTPAVPWATATSFIAGVSTIINGNLYRCLVSHTSGTFATDLAAGKWLFIATILDQTIAPTWTGLHTFNAGIVSRTTSGLTNPLFIDQTATGSSSSFINLNQIGIDDRTSAAGLNFVNGISIYQLINGGSSQVGGRQAVQIETRLVQPTNLLNPNRNYVGATIFSSAYSGDGGTSGSEKGNFTAINPIAVVRPGAQFVAGVVASEMNIAVQAGGSTKGKGILTLNTMPADAVKGTAGTDFVIAMSAAGSVQLDYGIWFTNASGSYPVSGTLIKQAGGTILHGIDLSGTTISGNAFNSLNFTVTGLGNVLARNVIVGSPGVVSGNMALQGFTSGIISLNVQSATGTYNWNWPTSAGAAGQPLLSGGGAAAAMTFGTLGAVGGGTGFAVYAVGDLLYADTTTTLAKLADVATGNALISGGVGVAPSWGKIGISTHVSGLGTGVAAALGVNVGSAGAPVVNGGALGTPASGAATNLTGLPLTTGVTGTLPVANGGTGATTVAGAQAALALGALAFTLPAANFNATTDQPIAITLPTGFTRYRLQAVLISNPSISLTTAVGGIYTAVAKGGIAVVAASTAYSGLTTNTAGANGSMLNATVTNVGTAFYNSATLYLSLTTPQGAAATADVTVFIQPLP